MTPAPLDDDRLLTTLQRLLAITSTELRSALTECSNLVADALGADKVDVFMYEPERDSLVALGTSQTLMGDLQHALGLHVFPRSNAGPLTSVFDEGEAYFTGHADRDPGQPAGVVGPLGVRSQLDVPLDVAGERRGVLSVVSAQEDRYTERDVEFVQAVSRWIGLVVERSERAQAQMRVSHLEGRRELADELSRLTRRQREVATLVAEGLSNEEIAERLVVTPGTMGNHLEQIMRRLGLRNRTQLAVWAVSCGLYRPGTESLGDY